MVYNIANSNNNENKKNENNQETLKSINILISFFHKFNLWIFKKNLVVEL